MFNKVMTVVILGVTSGAMYGASSVAIAATTMFQPKTVFTVNGKEVSANEALQAALASKAVMKCQAVALIPSKSGTSFSLRTPKKAKVSE